MSNPVIVVGTYDNRHRAELDYEHIAKNRDGAVERAHLRLALVERTSTGKVKVVNHLEPDADIGGIAGTVVGGLLGLLYPPIILVTAAAGGGVGTGRRPPVARGLAQGHRRAGSAHRRRRGCGARHRGEAAGRRRRGAVARHPGGAPARCSTSTRTSRR